MLTGDGEMVSRALRIKDLEREADLITRNCMDALHRTFITPIDRADIHKLIQRLDDIVDSVESTASRMVLYEITDRPDDARALTAVLVRAAEEITLALPGLRNMKNADEIKKHCVALYELENEGDNIMRNALAKLFREEKDPIALIKWKELYERLEKATDRCEAVASIIQSIVIEAS
jgi:predicted phosphate transport protein (TIGR00153 family)